MKCYANESKTVRVLKSVICDRCGIECANSHFDVTCKPSYSEQVEAVETICMSCWFAIYKNVMRLNADKQCKQRYKELDEEKVKKNEKKTKKRKK